MGEETEIDESLYSRQIYVLGVETMKKLSNANVLIVGLKSVGVEIAKNIILAGVKSVSLFDENLPQKDELSSNFYLKEEKLKEKRSKNVIKELSDLNSYVSVKVHQDPINQHNIQNFQVIVATNQSLEEQIFLNDITHLNNIKFISVNVYGVFGSIFCDFGDNFIVEDIDGENPLTAIVETISQDEEGIVTFNEETKHGFSEGDYVEFSEVKGMTELNQKEFKILKIITPFAFSIGNTKNFNSYISGGVATQVKKQKTLNFKKLSESISSDEIQFLTSDFAKETHPLQIHLSFIALNTFFKKKQRLPYPRNEEDAQEILNLVKELNEKRNEKIKIDEKLIKMVSYGARGNLSPISSVFGSIAAQEVLKACTGKFHPIFQHFFFDALEIVPENLTEEDCSPINSRYDGQIAVIGKKLHQNITNQRQFLVGSGAIGCEILKNWAMMGVSTGAQGKIFVTDMDSIEKSNLNRQFLFRHHDINKSKSLCASKATVEMNPDLSQFKIVAFQEKVGKESEELFNDDFYQNLTGVTNALDNVEARQYIDGRCLTFKKPLLESGTLGIKGSTQVVVPHITETYSSSRDPPEKSIPLCTLKYYPYLLEHTVQWSRDMFEGLFKLSPEHVKSFIANKNYLTEAIKQNRKDVIDAIKENMIDSKILTAEDCVSWAKRQFNILFNYKIVELLHYHPADSLSSSGVPFWFGTKRCPSPIPFDSKNDLHVDFVMVASRLKAETCGLLPLVERETIIKILEKDQSTNQSYQISQNWSETEESQSELDVREVANLERNLLSLEITEGLKNLELSGLDFEKDDDKNGHVDFISISANLRSMNYGIETGTRHKIKGIAGKIIPAMATTTALVAGLSCIELYKIASGVDDITKYKSAFINLALPFVGFATPVGAALKNLDGKIWTIWDRFEVQESEAPTLKDLIRFFKEKHKLEINAIIDSVTVPTLKKTLYTFYMDSEKKNQRLKMRMKDLIEIVTETTLPKYTKSTTLDIECDDKDEVPPIRYFFTS